MALNQCDRFAKQKAVWGDSFNQQVREMFFAIENAESVWTDKWHDDYKRHIRIMEHDAEHDVKRIERMTDLKLTDSQRHELVQLLLAWGRKSDV